MQEHWIYIVAILGGFIAGCINTLAGSGSAITLTILTELFGLPPNVANGSNRLGVLLQGIGGSYSFIKEKKLVLARDKFIIGSTFIGSLVGFYIAITISNEHFKTAFKYLMILMLFIVLVKPKRWLRPELAHPKPRWLLILVFFFIGIYGGFIQMGMGLFFLAWIVLGARYNLIEGNAVKVFTTALYTIIGILIFFYKGLIDWEIGGLLAIGQFFGGILTGNFAAKVKGADVVAYYSLIVALVFAIISLFF